MSAELSLPSLPPPVSEAFAAFPEAQRRVLLDVRALILAAAAGDDRVGDLTETLRWGEPAYLAERSGSTLRLGLTRQDRAPAMFVNCRTTLADEIREVCGDLFRYEGTRAIVLPANVREEAEAVRQAAHLALTYHLRRRMQ